MLTVPLFRAYFLDNEIVKGRDMAGPVQSRRDQNKVEKRGRIIAAARALFTHKGFDATTTQEIADAAGVAAGRAR